MLHTGKAPTPPGAGPPSCHRLRAVHLHHRPRAVPGCDPAPREHLRRLLVLHPLGAAHHHARIRHRDNLTALLPLPAVLVLTHASMTALAPSASTPSDSSSVTRPSSLTTSKGGTSTAGAVSSTAAGSSPPPQAAAANATNTTGNTTRRSITTPHNSGVRHASTAPPRTTPHPQNR